VKSISIGLLAIVFVCLAVFVVPVPALACEPRDEADARCEMPRPKPRVATRVAATPTPIPVVAKVTNRGLSPQDALKIEDKWQTVGASSYLWFMIDNGQAFYLTTVVEYKAAKGINLAAFSPEQESGLSNVTPPKGRGTVMPQDGNPRLWWKGTHAGGRWFFLVTNDNPSPVEVKMSLDSKSDDRQCRGYWEVDAFGKMIWWVDCGMYGLNK